MGGTEEVMIGNMRSSQLRLTLHFDGESVAGRGWDPVAGHTQILPHVQPADLLQPQLGSLQDVELLPGQQDVVPVLSPPDDVRWRVAAGVTGESHVVSLPHHHVLGLPGLHYGGRHWGGQESGQSLPLYSVLLTGLTHNLHVARPVNHRVGVDLTHVPAPVALLGTVQVEVPLVLPRPGQRDPGVPGDDVVVDGENGLSVHPDPGHLV